MSRFFFLVLFCCPGCLFLMRDLATLAGTITAETSFSLQRFQVTGVCTCKTRTERCLYPYKFSTFKWVTSDTALYWLQQQRLWGIFMIGTSRSTTASDSLLAYQAKAVTTYVLIVEHYGFYSVESCKCRINKWQLMARGMNLLLKSLEILTIK